MLTIVELLLPDPCALDLVYHITLASYTCSHLLTVNVMIALNTGTGEQVSRDKVSKLADKVGTRFVILI